jgi:hypothetical protein
VIDRQRGQGPSNAPSSARGCGSATTVIPCVSPDGTPAQSEVRRRAERLERAGHGPTVLSKVRPIAHIEPTGDGDLRIDTGAGTIDAAEAV